MSNFQRDMGTIISKCHIIENKLYHLKKNSLTQKHYDALMVYINETALGGEVDLSIYEKVSDVDLKLGRKVDIVNGKGLTSNDFTDFYKSTIDGLGSKYYDVTQTNLLLFNKVNKIEGKGLSTNDFTDSLKYTLENEVATKDLLDYKADLDYVDDNFVKKYEIVNLATKTELDNKVSNDDIEDIINIIQKPIYHKAVVQSLDGIWTYTFPEGLFTETPHIIVTAINDVKDSKNRANFASLDAGFSATSCAGIAKSCVSGGVLVAMEMGNANCPVHILAIQF